MSNLREQAVMPPPAVISKYPTEEARRDAVRKQGREWYHRNAHKHKAWSQAHPESNRRGKLKARYGITPEDVDHLLAAQGGKCAICGTSKPGGYRGQWHVDHCHEKNFVRGILCKSCNQALGIFKDNPRSLRAAADYLERSCLTTGCTGTGAQKSPLSGPLTRETRPPK